MLKKYALNCQLKKEKYELNEKATVCLVLANFPIFYVLSKNRFVLNFLDGKRLSVHLVILCTKRTMCDVKVMF